MAARRVLVGVLAAVAAACVAVPAGAQLPVPPVPVPPLPPGAYAPPTCTRSPDGELHVAPGATLAVTLTCIDPNGGAVTASIDTPPDYGTATVVPAGPNSFVVNYVAPATAYRGDGDYVGVTVRGSADYPGYVSFPVTIDVPPAPPRCYEGGQYYVPADQVAEIYAECESDDGGVFDIEIVSRPSHGELVQRGAGVFTYKPARGFRGVDQFTYRAKNATGASPVVTQRLQVIDAAPASRGRPGRGGSGEAALCEPRRVGEQCGPGYGRQTAGGRDKVSHRNWPKITGILWKVLDSRNHSKTGGAHNDELLGHHGNDTISGRAGTDVIWGDWDPFDNNGTQRDVLNGNAGPDFIYSSHGTNTITGGPGNDHIWAFYGHGTIDCGPGNDIVRLRGGSKAYKLKSCERRGTF